MAKFVCVKTFPSRVEAEVANSVLAANGINAIITADDKGGMAVPFVYGNKGVQVFVSSGEVDKSLALLKENKQKSEV